MIILFPLIAVMVLVAAALAGAQVTSLQYLLGVVLPYLAIAVFTGGFVWKVLQWARVPVPFRIPTTCGQQKSLPWIKHASIENPTTMLGVLARMFFEVFLFRSLFRNTKMELKEGPRLVYGSDKWLWLAGLVFHWTFLLIVVRHLRFFIARVPKPVQMLEGLDGFLQVGVPLLYISDVAILGAVTYLLIRRLVLPNVRFISLAADFFPLFLIIGIAVTGMLMRYLLRVDVVLIKQLAMGLVSFSPVVPDGISPLFFAHLLLICTLLLYFPFSKLMHMGGVFMSPTRNLANNNRMVRHVNPWNYDVKVHTYEQYEDEFRDKMKAVDLPLEKE